MTLTLNTGTVIELRKFSREFCGNQQDRIRLNLVVDAETVTFEELRKDFTSEAISAMTITDDENKKYSFKGYELDNIIEIHADFGVHDVMIRLYYNT